MKKILDKCEIVMNTCTNLSSDFLNPHEIKLAISILNSFDVSFSIDGGYDEAEYAVISIYPSFLNEPKDDPISCLKFLSIDGIKHNNVLGSLLGLGIDRRKIGDILIGEKFTYFFVKTELKNFIISNFKNISKNSINIYEKNNKDLLPHKEYSYKKIIVSSLRLDTFLSGALNISRNKVNNIIARDLVKINFTETNNISTKLKEGDILSIRKKGRIVFDKILKTTNKDKFICQIKIPK